MTTTELFPEWQEEREEERLIRLAEERAQKEWDRYLLLKHEANTHHARHERPSLEKWLKSGRIFSVKEHSCWLIGNKSKPENPSQWP